MKAVLTLVALCAILSNAFAAEYGHCKLVGLPGREPAVDGTITFETVGNIVRMTVQISGIVNNPDSTHGIHVHQYGDLSDMTAGLSVGDHFNPLAQDHGCPENGTARHLGDTGNWQATAGVISGTKDLDLLTLTGADSIIGRAVVLHNTTDNCVNTTSAGARLAFCVIGIGNTTANAAVNAATDVTYATCRLMPTQGQVAAGTVWFSQVAGQATVVTAAITGITGEHGLHIHQYGDMSSPTGLAALGHYDPYATAHHSIPIPGVNFRHAGDMGNIYHYEADTAYYAFTNNLVNLTGMNNVIGRAVILHAAMDNCSQPIGFSGARWAQCVIGITNVAPAPPAATVPTTQDFSMCPDAPATTGVATTGDNDSSSAAGVTVISVVLAVVAALAVLF